MVKQEDYNKLFLEKNRALDKEIETEWHEVLFSIYMENLYEKVDDFFNLILEDKSIDFYQGESDRYVLDISSILNVSEFEKYQDTFQIWFKDNGASYELHDDEFEACTNDEALYGLPDNKSRLEYIERKIKFLEWSKENKYKALEVLKDKVKRDKEESKQIYKDIKDLENLKW